MKPLDFTSDAKQALKTKYNEAHGYKSVLQDRHLRRKPEYCDECLHRKTGFCGSCPNRSKRRLA